MDYNIGLVDISGLCDPRDVTAVISENPYWLQMSIPETLNIPTQKPDMEQINSVNVSVNILRQEVIKVPESATVNGELQPNLEGKISTGRKIIVEGELCQKIVYTANDEEQSVHSAHFYVPFSSYIVVPKELNISSDPTAAPVDSLNINYQVNACIEDVIVRMVDERTILKQVTMLVYAVPGQTV
ncbi:TPA: DUF3794 domain-containing protein [Clostridium perfringens]|nr:DUF3794 domain-containing protein [Clostridium perfringens]HAT4313885.1 DUF3794 domain-containing protein [Clostridium perfringens]